MDYLKTENQSHRIASHRITSFNLCPNHIAGTIAVSAAGLLSAPQHNVGLAALISVDTDTSRTILT